ncbi:hypothetical protein TRVL_04986 [Trypanosoma vivax]|nr:hypothetical protein TRVL_04986 [Trypanosoma vivax]
MVRTLPAVFHTALVLHSPQLNLPTALFRPRFPASSSSARIMRNRNRSSHPLTRLRTRLPSLSLVFPRHPRHTLPRRVVPPAAAALKQVRATSPLSLNHRISRNSCALACLRQCSSPPLLLLSPNRREHSKHTTLQRPPFLATCFRRRLLSAFPPLLLCGCTRRAS